MALSDAAIAQAARAGGFPDSVLATAVAVALAESGGNPDAQNRNTNGTTDFGLWQINSIHKADLSGGQWQNPSDNARMAYAVYKRAGNSWWPWYAFRGGRHVQYMGRASEAVKNIGSATSAATSFATASQTLNTQEVGLMDTWDEAKKILNLLGQKNFWIVVGYTFAGFMLIIAGMVWLGKGLATGGITGAAVSAVKKVV